MPIRFFNTLSRKKEPFVPIRAGKAALYTCGPTVYDFPHIGNFRTYVFEDILRRWLFSSGYDVIQVMNLTDVDDKTIRGSREAGICLADYTKPFIDAFFEDVNALAIQRAEHYPRATEHVPEMVAIIRDLLLKKIAYRGEDGSIYYAVSKFPRYGELAHIAVGDLRPGARVRQDEYEKAEASDFALWKAWDAEDGDVFWDTELGKGRPGWHIECSAMSMKYLGPQFDLHTGGVDNIFPHHQNEIAQSEAHTGKRFVNTWLHAEHLAVDGRKMSKSLGNFYTVREVLAKGYSSRALRYFYAASHYRNKLNFTFEALAAAHAAVERIEDFLRRVNEANGKPQALLPQILEDARREFSESMDDDLNTPRAIAAVHDLVTRLHAAIDARNISNDQVNSIWDFFLWVDRIFSLGLARLKDDAEPSGEISLLVAKREDARKAKDYRKADEIRRALEEKGIVVEDTPFGPRCKRLFSKRISHSDRKDDPR